MLLSKTENGHRIVLWHRGVETVLMQAIKLFSLARRNTTLNETSFYFIPIFQTDSFHTVLRLYRLLVGVIFYIV